MVRQWTMNGDILMQKVENHFLKTAFYFQERVSAKQPPSFYLTKLRVYLDPTASKSSKVLCLNVSNRKGRMHGNFLCFFINFTQYLSIASEQLKCIKLFTIALNFSKTMEQLLLFCWLPEKNFRTIWLE